MFRFRAILIVLMLAVPSIAFAALKPGDAMPSLSTFQLEGAIPDNLKGNVILIDFWATWCVPCKASFPVLDGLHKKFHDQGLTIIGVSTDDEKAKVDRFIKEHPATFTIVRDAAQKLVAAADVDTMPTSLLIDRAGKIRFIHNGFSGDKTAKEYAEQIEQLLKEPKP